MSVPAAVACAARQRQRAPSWLFTQVKLLLISNRWTKEDNDLIFDVRPPGTTQQHRRLGMMLKVRGWVEKTVRLMLYPRMAAAAQHQDAGVWLGTTFTPSIMTNDMAKQLLPMVAFIALFGATCNSNFGPGMMSLRIVKPLCDQFLQYVAVHVWRASCVGRGRGCTLIRTLVACCLMLELRSGSCTPEPTPPLPHS